MTVHTENSISIKKGGRFVIASPAAKAATCQLLGHSGSRQACVVSTYIIQHLYYKEGQGSQAARRS
jgi:hypothetical protein